MTGADVASQLRDTVRDSRISSKLNQGSIQASMELRQHWKQDSYRVERDLPRRPPAWDCEGEQEVMKHIGITSSNEDVESWFLDYMEKEAPFLGVYRRNTVSESIISRFKRNLPLFDGFWHTDDFLGWIDDIEDFFAEVKPPGNLRCKIVWSKMEGVAYYWWKVLQTERISKGKDPISSWYRMRTLLIARFALSNYSKKCPNENSSPVEGSVQVRSEELVLAENNSKRGDKNVSLTEVCDIELSKEAAEIKTTKCSEKAACESITNRQACVSGSNCAYAVGADAFKHTDKLQHDSNFMVPICSKPYLLNLVNSFEPNGVAAYHSIRVEYEGANIMKDVNVGPHVHDTSTVLQVGNDNIQAVMHCFDPGGIWYWNRKDGHRQLTSPVCLVINSWLVNEFTKEYSSKVSRIGYDSCEYVGETMMANFDPGGATCHSTLRQCWQAHFSNKDGFLEKYFPDHVSGCTSITSAALKLISILDGLFHVIGIYDWKTYCFCSMAHHLDLEILSEIFHLNFDPGGMWENGQTKADGEGRRSKFLVRPVLSFWFGLSKTILSLCPSQYYGDFAFGLFSGNAHMKCNSSNETWCGLVRFCRLTSKPSCRSCMGGLKPCLTMKSGGKDLVTEVISPLVDLLPPNMLMGCHHSTDADQRIFNPTVDFGKIICDQKEEYINGDRVVGVEHEGAVTILVLHDVPQAGNSIFTLNSVLSLSTYDVDFLVNEVLFNFDPGGKRAYYFKMLVKEHKMTLYIGIYGYLVEHKAVTNSIGKFATFLFDPGGIFCFTRAHCTSLRNDQLALLLFQNDFVVLGNRDWKHAVVTRDEVVYRGIVVRTPIGSLVIVIRIDSGIPSPMNIKYSFLGILEDFKLNEVLEATGSIHSMHIDELQLGLYQLLEPCVVDEKGQLLGVLVMLNFFQVLILNLLARYRIVIAEMLIGKLVNSKCERVTCTARKLVTIVFDPGGGLCPRGMWRTCLRSGIVVSLKADHYVAVFLFCQNRIDIIMQASSSLFHEPMHCIFMVDCTVTFERGTCGLGQMEEIETLCGFTRRDDAVHGITLCHPCEDILIMVKSIPKYGLQLREASRKMKHVDASLFHHRISIDFNETRGQAISGVSWNGESVKERDFFMVAISAVIIHQDGSVLWKAGQWRVSLKLFHDVVNGLDPPMSIDADPYEFARDELFVGRDRDDVIRMFIYIVYLVIYIVGGIFVFYGVRVRGI